MTQITQALEALADWLDKEAFDCERNARETAMDHPQAVQSLLGARANSLRNRAATVREAIAALSSAAPSAAAPEISTAHGPWLPSRYDEGETYCERCLTRSVFADKRKCEPHIVSAPQAASEPVADNWRQYATERENTAQQVVERHRQEHDSLLRLLANARKEQEHAYRCIQGMHHALTTETLFNQGYHAPTIGAAKRFVFEGALDGSEYFIGKPVDVLHTALSLPATEKNHE